MTDIARTAKQIGALIRRHRKKAKMSQSDLASLVGLRQATISQIETGSPATRIDTILSILGVMGLEAQISTRTKSSHTDIEDAF